MEAPIVFIHGLPGLYPSFIPTIPLSETSKMAPNNLSPQGSVVDNDYDDKHAAKEMTMHLENDNEATFENRNFSTMTAEDRATALKLAHEADPGPALFSYRFLCFIGTCFVVIVNSCDTGFDTTIMSSVNSMVTFQSYFGLESATTGTGILFVSQSGDRYVLNDADLVRVFTLSEVSAHSFPTSSCRIS
jgi:hypothetical protein